MSPEELVGRSLAVVFAMETDELEWQIIRGTIAQNSDSLVVIREAQSPFVLHENWLARIKPIADSDASIQAMLGTDFWLIVTIGALPQK